MLLSIQLLKSRVFFLRHGLEQPRNPSLFKRLHILLVLLGFLSSFCRNLLEVCLSLAIREVSARDTIRAVEVRHTEYLWL